MKKLFFFLAILASFGVQAKTIKLDSVYGLNAFQERVQAKNLFANIGAFKVKCKNAYKHWNDLSVSDARIMEMTVATAYAIDATWTDAPNPKYIGMPSTVHDILWPEGKWQLSDTWKTSFGDNEGKGEFAYYPNNTVTELSMAEDLWLGAEDLTDGGVTYRMLVVTPTWGDNGSLGYAEGWSIKGIRLVGPNHPYSQTAYRIGGLGVWDMGEMGQVDVRSDQWDIGVLIVRGTPYLSMKTTTFNNVIWGVLSMGGALGGGAIADLTSCEPDSLRKFFSGDDNGRLFGCRAGFGRQGGGAWVIVYGKAETAVTEEARGRWTGQTVIDAEGSFNIVMVNMNVASAWVKSDAIYVVNGQSYSSSLTVIGSAVHGYCVELRDVGNHFQTAYWGDHRKRDLKWSSEGGGSCAINGVLQPKIPTPCTGRLGMQRMVNGVLSPAWDYQRCTPGYSDFGPVTDPPPGPCTATWVPGTKTCSTCTGGKMTCTQVYVSSTTACNPTSPKPADVVTQENCGTVPVGELLWSQKFAPLKNPSQTTATYKVPTPPNVGTVTKTKLVNVKFKSLPVAPDLAWINSNLMIGNDGYLWTASPFASTGIKVTANEAINRDIPMPGTTLTYVIGHPAQATAIFTGTIEIY